MGFLCVECHPTKCQNHTTTVLRPFFRDHPVEIVPEENFWTLWCKGRLTQADTLTIQLGATPSGLTSAHLHHTPHIFYGPDALPAAQPTVKALKASCVRTLKQTQSSHIMQESHPSGLVVGSSTTRQLVRCIVSFTSALQCPQE